LQAGVDQQRAFKGQPSVDADLVFLGFLVLNGHDIQIVPTWDYAAI